DPIRHPERALARRNAVLVLMKQNGSVSESESAAAIRTPLRIAESYTSSVQDQWFINLAVASLDNKEPSRSASRVYTTLDADLQREAEEAIQAGLRDVDRRALMQRRQALP